MKTCIYFAENQKKLHESAFLLSGFGFTKARQWRSIPIPGDVIGILIDDRYLPCREGITTAIRALRDWNGMIILDCERPRTDLLAMLTKGLRGKSLVLPPPYADCFHEAVLIGPWRGECDFARWLSRMKAQYGRVFLDAAPLRMQCFPGGCRRPWNRPLPDRGYPCPALGCLHRRLPDSSILFWDSRQTLSARLTDAAAPRIQFSADWDTLPDSPTE